MQRSMERELKPLHTFVGSIYEVLNLVKKATLVYVEGGMFVTVMVGKGSR